MTFTKQELSLLLYCADSEYHNAIHDTWGLWSHLGFGFRDEEENEDERDRKDDQALSILKQLRLKLEELIQ